MNILVVGGTRFMGVHLVKNLLAQGHAVTIVNRGQTPDGFGTQVRRLQAERTDAQGLAAVLAGRHYDCVCDSLAICSDDVKYLLDAVSCDRYIQISSLSVYSDFHLNMNEKEFDPITHRLEWCSREAHGYDEVKRQAECAIFQAYNLPAVSVRFPYVIGTDDYTGRLFFYVAGVVNGRAMWIDNLDAPMAFVHSAEAGKFLAWLCGVTHTGSVNAGSYGVITLAEVIAYVEKKSGKTAIITQQGDEGPYNGTPAYAMSLEKAAGWGYTFSRLDSWIYTLLDDLIALA